MKKKILKLACSGILSLVLISPIAASAAPAPTVVPASTVHVWGAEKVIDSHEEIVVRNHECTICGAKVNLYKRVYKKERVCQKCGVHDVYEESSATYSNHSCYN